MKDVFGGGLEDLTITSNGYTDYCFQVSGLASGEFRHVRCNNASTYGIEIDTPIVSNDPGLITTRNLFSDIQVDGLFGVNNDTGVIPAYNGSVPNTPMIGIALNDNAPFNCYEAGQSPVTTAPPYCSTVTAADTVYGDSVSFNTFKNIQTKTLLNAGIRLGYTDSNGFYDVTTDHPASYCAGTGVNSCISIEFLDAAATSGCLGIGSGNNAAVYNTIVNVENDRGLIKSWNWFQPPSQGSAANSYPTKFQCASPASSNTVFQNPGNSPGSNFSTDPGASITYCTDNGVCSGQAHINLLATAGAPMNGGNPNNNAVNLQNSWNYTGSPVPAVVAMGAGTTPGIVVSDTNSNGSSIASDLTSGNLQLATGVGNAGIGAPLGQAFQIAGTGCYTFSVWPGTGCSAATGGPIVYTLTGSSNTTALYQFEPITITGINGSAYGFGYSAACNGNASGQLVIIDTTHFYISGSNYYTQCPAPQTANLTNNSATVNGLTTSAFTAGLTPVSDTHTPNPCIPPNTIVATVVSGSQITLSNPASCTVTGDTLIFGIEMNTYSTAYNTGIAYVGNVIVQPIISVEAGFGPLVKFTIPDADFFTVGQSELIVTNGTGLGANGDYEGTNVYARSIGVSTGTCPPNCNTITVNGTVYSTGSSTGFLAAVPLVSPRDIVTNNRIGAASFNTLVSYGATVSCSGSGCPNSGPIEITLTSGSTAALVTGQFVEVTGIGVFPVSQILSGTTLILGGSSWNSGVTPTTGTIQWLDPSINFVPSDNVTRPAPANGWTLYSDAANANNPNALSAINASGTVLDLTYCSLVDGSKTAPCLPIGSSTNGFFNNGSNTPCLATASSVAFCVDGGQRLLVGGVTSGQSIDATESIFQILGTTSTTATSETGRWSNDIYSPATNFFKSRGTSVGQAPSTSTKVQTGDALSQINTFGDDGHTSGGVAAATLQVAACGTINTGKVPSCFQFETANSSGVLTTWWTIDSGGYVCFGTTSSTCASSKIILDQLGDVTAQGYLTSAAGAAIGGPTGGVESTSSLNVKGFYYANGTQGLSCSGTPTTSFATTNGIVTHC